jgi:hypothetical protein
MKKIDATAMVTPDGKLVLPTLPAPELKPGIYRIHVEIEEPAIPTTQDETLTIPKKGSGKAGRFIVKKP